MEFGIVLKCQICGKDVDLPFKCSYCQGYFCIDHKLPENHQCPNLPKEPLFWYQNRKISEKRVATYPSSKQRQSRKVRTAILAVSIITILIIAFLFLSGTLELNIGTPLGPSVKDTTTCRVILQGKLSVFEGEGCTEAVQTIDWGKVESNHQYSRTVYVRNDNEEKGLDWGERDIVWQRENINPDSVYISIRCNYGNRKISPNEVRQVNITLTVLGAFDSSGELNPNTEVPQFTFDLRLIGRDLNPIFPPVPRCYANRDANNITIVFKDELKETISILIEIGVWKTNGEQILDVVWNSTVYSSEFAETWLEANKYTSYQLVVTINHERYGELSFRNYLVGQLP